MGKKSKAPPAPDPNVTAAAQAQANRDAIYDSARVNQFNQVTPYGSRTYSGAIGSPDRTETTSLSPSGQRQLDTDNNIAESLKNFAYQRTGQINQSPFSLDGLPQLYGSYQNVNTAPSEKSYIQPGAMNALGRPSREDFITGYAESNSPQAMSYEDWAAQQGGGSGNGFYQDPRTGQWVGFSPDSFSGYGDKDRLMQQYGDMIAGEAAASGLTLSQFLEANPDYDYNNMDGAAAGMFRLETGFGPQADTSRSAYDQYASGFGNEQGGPIYDDAAYQAALDASRPQPVIQEPAQAFTPQPTDSTRVNDVESALMQRLTNLLNPVWDRQDSRQAQKLANMGHAIGGEAYNDDYQRHNSQKNEAYLNAGLQSVLAGSAEDSRLFGQSLQARNQGINERMAERSQPMNELAMLLGGAPQMPTPQFGNAAQYQINPADVMGAFNQQYAGQMNAYNQQQQSNRAGMGGLFSLGGTVIGGMFGGPAGAAAGGALGSAIGGG